MWKNPYFCNLNQGLKDFFSVDNLWKNPRLFHRVFILRETFPQKEISFPHRSTGFPQAFPQVSVYYLAFSPEFSTDIWGFSTGYYLLLFIKSLLNFLLISFGFAFFSKFVLIFMVQSYYSKYVLLSSYSKEFLNFLKLRRAHV